jgi:hypothetical protein
MRGIVPNAALALAKPASLGLVHWLMRGIVPSFAPRVVPFQGRSRLWSNEAAEDLHPLQTDHLGIRADLVCGEAGPSLSLDGPSHALVF